MRKVFVINYTDSIIFQKTEDGRHYDEEYETFEEAKVQLIAYWENALTAAKLQLKEAKKIKLSNVEIIP